MVFGIVIFVSVPLIFNIVQIWRNWNKAYDDIKAKIWYEYVSEEGFDERILFCYYDGVALNTGKTVSHILFWQ
ncbi:MAG: hypothetical protein K1W41_03400 [Lachnospiraceae bacterium]